MSYQVKLDVFEGPFDLLVYLIERSGMDIYTVNISEITDQYIACIRSGEHVNPEMAAEFYICPRTLNNRLRASCSQTFSAYQMDLKLEMVREFLAHQPDAKLHEAAVNFGFYDEFHLSKAFKKKYGYPPSKLRGSIDKKGTLD